MNVINSNTRLPGDAPALPPPRLDTDARFGAHYAELRRMARSRLRRHETFTLLNTTALVHESYVRLLKAGGVRDEEEPAFLAYACEVMRSVITDAARARLTQRRSDGVNAERLGDEVDGLVSEAPAKEILELDDALRKLHESHPRLADVIALQYFGGMTDTEVATALGMSVSTVRRDMSRAHLMLRAMLS